MYVFTCAPVYFLDCDIRRDGPNAEPSSFPSFSSVDSLRRLILRGCVKAHIFIPFTRKSNPETMSSALFKRFDVDSAKITPLKSSAHRAVLKDVKAQYPKLTDDDMERIAPKKVQLLLAKCPKKISFVLNGDTKEPLFFQERDGPFYPTLKLLQRIGDFMPVMRIDTGGISHIMSGSNAFAVGFTKIEDGLPEEVDADVPVAIYGEGKRLPLAIGLTKMSSEEIRETESGVAVETIHFITDDLFMIGAF